MRRIMIVRHAEKPGDADPDHGVTEQGAHDPHDLTVRGWQRAGALVRFFAPRDEPPRERPGGVSTPAAIIASAATPRSPSRRALHTVKPLARALGLPVDHRHAAGEEEAVAAAALAAPSPVLIAWHHHSIRRLVRAVAGDGVSAPHDWPDDRFDVVWVLDETEPATWRLSQVAQRLLAHDHDEVIGS